MSVILPVCDYLQQTVDPSIANCAVESLKFAASEISARCKGIGRSVDTTKEKKNSQQAHAKISKQQKLHDAHQKLGYQRLAKSNPRGALLAEVKSTKDALSRSKAPHPRVLAPLDANTNNPIEPQQPRKKTKPNNATDAPAIDPSTIRLPRPHGGELVYYPREALLNFRDAQANIEQLSGTSNRTQPYLPTRIAGSSSSLSASQIQSFCHSR
jgi:hypothetical protein